VLWVTCIWFVVFCNLRNSTFTFILFLTNSNTFQRDAALLKHKNIVQASISYQPFSMHSMEWRISEFLLTFPQQDLELVEKYGRTLRELMSGENSDASFRYTLSVLLSDTRRLNIRFFQIHVARFDIIIHSQASCIAPFCSHIHWSAWSLPQQRTAVLSNKVTELAPSVLVLFHLCLCCSICASVPS